ncbi:hypothetical protein CO675_13255 [Bradyrhizobium sp. C9]|nr:hypothetical protein CO675_13255 [Bradyrhizobium sp. C9]
MIILDIQFDVISCSFIVRVDDVMTTKNLHFGGAIPNHRMGLAYSRFNLCYQRLDVTRSSLKKLVKLGRLGWGVLSQISGDDATDKIV